jgi:hypothetical protein
VVGGGLDESDGGYCDTVFCVMNSLRREFAACV